MANSTRAPTSCARPSLRRRPRRAGRPVCVERSLELVVGVLGILKAGGAYVPLDPDPADRLAFMLEDAAASVPRHPAALARPSSARCRASGSALIAIGRRSPHTPTQSGTGATPATSPTSSTPRARPAGPRGYRSPTAMSPLMTATEELFDFARTSGLCSTRAFDFSVWEIWGACCTAGARSWYRSGAATPRHFSPCSARAGHGAQPDAVHVRPADAGWGGGRRPRLRHIVFGGEALDLSGLRPWLDRDGDPGPGWSTCTGSPRRRSTSPTGRVRLEDLDLRRQRDRRAHPRPAPVHAGPPTGSRRPSASRARFRGRRRRGPRLPEAPGADSEQFVADPFSGQPRARIYRSGDLAALGRRRHRVPGPDRPAGQDPRLPRRAGRDRGDACAAPGVPRPWFWCARTSRKTGGWRPTSCPKDGSLPTSSVSAAAFSGSSSSRIHDSVAFRDYLKPAAHCEREARPKRARYLRHRAVGPT